MARWIPKPEESILPAEYLGRRLFDQPQLIGAKGQKATLRSLDLRNFEDPRNNQVSLDRLGRTNPERAVLGYLTPRAESEGAKRKPPKKFDAWASIQTKRLLGNKQLPVAVVAEPISSEVELDENVYHSYVHPRDECAPHYLALHLRDLFEKHGGFEFSPNHPERPGWLRRRVLGLIEMLQLFAERLR